MYVSSWNDIEALFAGKTKDATEVIDYKPGRELEDDFIRKFKRHPSWYVLEYREQHGEHPNWDQFLRDILASAEVPKPKTDDNIDWETEKERIKEIADQIPVDDFDPWLYDMIMPIHDACNGSEDGRALCHELSARSEKYKHGGAKQLNRQWDHLNQKDEHPNPRKLGSLFRHRKNDEVQFTTNKLPKAGDIEPGILTNLIEEDLRADFSRFRPFPHRPSEEQFDALMDIPKTIEAMADGRLGKFFYISSLHPGMGKTKSIIHSVRRIVNERRYDGIGIIVCVGRYKEIKRITEDLGIEDFATYTADEEINKLGKGKNNRNQARVLFTTHKMVTTRLEGRRFSEADEFFYNGKPREVKIWDEACLPGRQLLADVSEIHSMIKPVTKKHPKLKDVLLAIIKSIEAARHGETIEIPDLDEIITEQEARETFDGWRVDLDTVSSLWQMSGLIVNVVRDYGRNTAISYTDHFPEDIKPIFVSDASASIRKAYEKWAQGRSDILELKYEDKDYGKFQIHVCNEGGGKNSINERPTEYGDAALKVINENRDKQCLVIHHKTLWNFDMKEYINQQVQDRQVKIDGLFRDRVSFLHWGDHAGTNEFADYPIQIMVGTPYYEPSHAHSLAMMMLNKTAEEFVDKKDVREVDQGEWADGILQGGLRHSARKSIGKGCPFSHLYIFAKKMIRGMLPTIFPGCVIDDWTPIAEELTPKQIEAMDVIETKEKIRRSRVAKAIEMDKDNFKRIIDKKFQEALAKKGYMYQSGYGSYFKKLYDGPLF